MEKGGLSSLGLGLDEAEAALLALVDDVDLAGFLGACGGAGLVGWGIRKALCIFQCTHTCWWRDYRGQKSAVSYSRLSIISIVK